MARSVESTATHPGQGLDRDGRTWVKAEDGETWEKLFGGLTSAEAKRAFALRKNVEAFTAHYAHQSCGFLTLTPLDGDMSPKEFAAAFDDMRKHSLKWLKAYVRVLELQKRGAPHHHLVVATPYDLKPSAFDWEALQGAAEARKRGDLGTARALTKRYAQSAPDELRAIWAELREVCPKYGLGRSEFLPFRKEAGAVAHYVGKYLEGGLSFRRDEWKGCRRVEYDRGESRLWKSCGSAFGWVSPGAKAWRERVGELAAAIGADTPADLVRILGPRWAYHARPTIMMEPDPEWRRFLAYLVSEYGGKMERKPRLTHAGEVVAWWPAYGETEDPATTCTILSPNGFRPRAEEGDVEAGAC